VAEAAHAPSHTDFAWAVDRRAGLQPVSLPVRRHVRAARTRNECV